MGEAQAREGNLRGSLGKIRCSITLPDAIRPPLFADDLLAEYPIRIGAVDMVSFLWMDIDE